MTLFAHAASQSFGETEEFLRVKETMRRLFETDTIIVVPFGNYATWVTNNIDIIPGTWGNATFPLTIVVGNKGKGSLDVRLAEPGENVLCAIKGDKSVIADRTSLATSMVLLLLVSSLSMQSKPVTEAHYQVAGLLAYLLSLPQVLFAVGRGKTAYHVRAFFYATMQPQDGKEISMALVSCEMELTVLSPCSTQTFQLTEHDALYC